jgi:cell division protein FtsB
MLPHLTSPQRVDLSIAAMEADMQTLRARGAALKAFYATLSSGQQQIFDSQTLPRDDEQ